MVADQAAASDDTAVTFHVKSGTQKWTLTLPLATTTIDLKAKLATEEYANVPATSQRLIYSGKVMKDHETLSTHNVKEGNTMHLVKSAASNQRQNPASQSTTVPNAGTAQNTGVPQNLAAGTGNDPLAGLTGARYAGFAGLPSLESLANPPTPEDMLRRLQDPNFAQQMNEVLQNPQMIDMMINSNPQLRAMGPQARQMLQSEQFRRMITNPEALRSMMQLQNAMGGDPFGGFGGGGGGQAAFPAPGVTNPAEQTTGQTQPQNTFNTTATGGQQPSNPFLSFLNPQQGQATQPGRDTSQPNQTQLGGPDATAGPGANPFLNPLLFQNPTGDPNQPSNPMYDAFARMLADPSAALGPNAPTGQNTAGQGQDPFAALAALAAANGQGFGGMGPFGGSPAPADNRPPEERYAQQLRQLNEMGFHDFERNITALSRSGGDVNGALEWLFSQP